MKAASTRQRLAITRLKPRRRKKMPPILFLHGAFVGAWCWGEHFMPWFHGKGYDVTAFSFSGHGESQSDRPLHHLGISDYVNDTLEVIDTLDQPPILIGHSMGGFVAQKACMQRDVAALVLMAAVPPTGLMAPSWTMAAFKPSLFWQLGVLQTLGEEFVDAQSVQASLFGPEAEPDLYARYAAYIQVESYRAIMDMYGSELSFAPLSTACPVLVLGAEDDVMVAPPYVHATAAYHGVSAQIIADMGHGMMLDVHWEQVATHINSWLCDQDIGLETKDQTKPSKSKG